MGCQQSFPCQKLILLRNHVLFSTLPCLAPNLPHKHTHTHSLTSRRGLFLQGIAPWSRTSFYTTKCSQCLRELRSFCMESSVNAQGLSITFLLVLPCYPYLIMFGGKHNIRNLIFTWYVIQCWALKGLPFLLSWQNQLSGHSIVIPLLPTQFTLSNSQLPESLAINTDLMNQGTAYHPPKIMCVCVHAHACVHMHWWTVFLSEPN